MKKTILSHYYFYAQIIATAIAAMVVFPILGFYAWWWYGKWQTVFMPCLGWALGTVAGKTIWPIVRNISLQAYQRKLAMFRCNSCYDLVESPRGKFPSCSCEESIFKKLNEEQLRKHMW